MSDLLDPRKARDQHEVTVDLQDGTHVLARKEDIQVLVFEGRVPMPMLTAVQKMIDMPSATPIERVASLGDEAKSLLDVLRTHACRVVITPTLVLEEDGNRDHLPVSYLDIQQLMAIWKATAVVPEVGVASAARFRARQPADDAAAVSNGQDVPSAPEPLAVPERVEFVSV